MNIQEMNKEMTVYDLARMIMPVFEGIDDRFDSLEVKVGSLNEKVGVIENTMVTKDDLEKTKNELKKELRKEIADTNHRLDNMKLFIPSLI